MASFFSSLTDRFLHTGKYLMEVDMFPVFFIAHVCLSAILVRDDAEDIAGASFRRRHPLASWLCTFITTLSGLFVTNFLFGSPLVDALKENKMIIIVTIIWYLINYSPHDLAYAVVKFRPVSLAASILQECLRLRFIYLGVQQTADAYPEAYVIIILSGVINGNGYGLIKLVENLIRGKWTPATNELLDVTYFTKSSVYASVLLLLHRNKILGVPIELLYLGIITVFVIIRVLIEVGYSQDPLLPLESPVYSQLFGSDKEENNTVKGKQNQNASDKKRN